MSSEDAPHPPKAPNRDYEILADKVGFVPNLRKSDNLFQIKFIGVTILACGVFAMIVPLGYPEPPLLVKALLGLFAGLVLGLILSGLVLAIKNLKR